jgi:hypothetical protein
MARSRQPGLSAITGSTLGFRTLIRRRWQKMPSCRSDRYPVAHLSPIAERLAPVHSRKAVSASRSESRSPWSTSRRIINASVSLASALSIIRFEMDWQSLSKAAVIRRPATISESDFVLAPCGDSTRCDGIPRMALQQYACRHDRYARDSAKMGVRRLEVR